MLTVIVKGSYGNGNLGDDLLYSLVCETVYQVIPEKHVFFYCSESNYLKLINPYHKSINSLMLSDDMNYLLILGGGTQIASFTQDYFQISSKFLTSNSVKKTIQVFKRKKILKRIMKSKPILSGISIGIGPFSNLQSEENARQLICQFSYLWIRDQFSLDFCSNWKIPADRIILAPDISLLNSYKYRRLAIRNAEPSQFFRIGFVPRDWDKNGLETSSFLLPMIKANTQLEHYRAESKFYLFDKENDKKCSSFLKQLKTDFWTWDPSNMTLDKAIEELCCCDIIVTARYHGALIAMMLGIPCVTVDIEPKLSIATNEFFKVNHWCSPFDSNELVNIILEMLPKIEEQRTIIFGDADVAAQKAKKSVDDFLHWLSSTWQTAYPNKMINGEES